MKAGIVLGAAIIALILSGIPLATAPAGGAGGFILPPGANLRWGLSAIHAPEAWQVTQGSEDIVVAVIDSGIDRSIPALADRMWRNPDEVPGNGIDDDGNGYVTTCTAGTSGTTIPTPCPAPPCTATAPSWPA